MAVRVLRFCVSAGVLSCGCDSGASRRLFAAAAMLRRRPHRDRPRAAMAPFPVTCRRSRWWSRNFPAGICAAISASAIRASADLEPILGRTIRCTNIDLGFDASPLFGLGIGYYFNDWLRFDVTGEYRGTANFHGSHIGNAAAAAPRPTNTPAASRNGCFCSTAMSISAPGTISRRSSAPASA